jgi:peptidoglycan hydrolase-like protein with peptidoglycan-binding domain
MKMAAKKSSGKKAAKKRASRKAAGQTRGAARSAAPAPETAAEATPAAAVTSAETLTVTVLRRGARGPEVETMQNELVDLGYLRREQMATAPGVFGPLTEDAVKHLQRDNFLDENGTYDEPTQEVIRQVNEGVARGTRGSVVRGLQNRLVALGLLTVGQVSSGPGLFGPQTEEALRMFQRVHGINPSGTLTDETYKALLAAAPAPVRPAPGGGSSTGIDTVLPSEGRGFTTYRREPGGADQFGRASTIRALIALGEAWAARHERPRIQVGDISRRGGGPMPPHASHQRGVDADLRPMMRDGREEAVQWNNPLYSRELTRELVQLIRANNPGATVLFNDPRLIAEGLTRRAGGHDNHLHVRFPA